MEQIKLIRTVIRDLQRTTLQNAFDINISKEYAVAVSLFALSVMNARVYYQNKKIILYMLNHYRIEKEIGNYMVLRLKS